MLRNDMTIESVRFVTKLSKTVTNFLLKSRMHPSLKHEILYFKHTKKEIFFQIERKYRPLT